MRQVFLIGFLSISFLCSGQFEFEPDSSEHGFPFLRFKDTELDWPKEDSIEFEIRFWVSTEFSVFLQIACNTDSIWNSRSGFLVPDDGKIVRTVDLVSNI